MTVRVIPRVGARYGRLLVAAIATAAVLHGSGTSVRGQNGNRPKLIVILVVDQLRADYLEDYGRGFTGGLRRLMTGGAWFTEAAYPYLNTVTCAGHSTIGTGSFPYRHGMILNSWYDRQTGRSPYCTDDPNAREISYNGLTPTQGDSAARMLAPSIGEQVKQHGGRSVVMSLKPRSAVSLTGRLADAAVWFDERGGWATSSAYSDGPVPFLAAFIAANPIEADFDKVWDRTLAASAYEGEDDAKGEGSPAGWIRTFPHPLGTAGGKPDGTFYSRWQRSPFSDEYLGRMAAAAVDALRLGQQESTDYLGVSFSALDLVGHAYGPRSHEVQDLLLRLDLTVGRLLQHLDEKVGAGNYVVGLSSDHGVAEIPEQRHDAGRHSGRDVIEAAQKVLVPALGPGAHVVATAYTDIYLSPAARARISTDRKLSKSVLDALEELPGIDRVFRGDELASPSARTSRDRTRRAAALSYYPDRSGDLILAPKKNWLLATSTTTHGTHHPYDQRVPVIVYGAAVRPGLYSQDATPADLAPTLASAANVPLAPTDGRVLAEALTGQDRSGPIGARR